MTEDQLSTVKGIVWAIPVSLILWAALALIVSGVFHAR